jgi:hypothetical protein
LQSALVAVAGRVWFITEVVMVCLTICDATRDAVGVFGNL